MTLPLEHIEGKYEILHKIKEGGMGAIYKVRHRLLEEIRVIKVIRPQFAEDQDLKRRFAREAKTAIRLRHPNIAQLYDFAAGDGGTAYMVMEFIDGHTLQETLRHYGPPSLGLAVDLLCQALQALDYLHRQGYVHRDLSPDNLMMTRDFDERPMLKLIDLGIVKRLGAEVNLTTTGTFLGKVRYSSPEQFNTETGSAKVDARSDVYSFGLLTYELLTGRFPIPGDDFRQLLTGHLMHPPLAFDESDPGGRVPDELREVILRALEKEPADRFSRAREFAERLEAFGADFETYRHEFARRMSRSDVTQRMEPVPRPGSTQERLNEQFGVEPTPSPTDLTPPPPPPPDPEAERKKRKAERAEAERRQREAKIAELLGHALETREDDPETARGALQELLELEPGHNQARNLLEHVEADLERRRAAAARREKARGLYEQARDEVEGEDWDQARDLLQQALALDDEHTEAQALLGRVDTEIERLEAEREAERRRAEALEAARSAVAELLDAEDPDAAETRLQEAESELETEFPALHTRIDDLRAELARRARARDAYEQARHAVDAENLDKARGLLLQALEALPQHAEAKTLLDEVDAELRRREEEAERARRLAEAVGDIERHLDQGQVDTAARELDFAVQTWGGSPELVTLARRIDEEKRRWEREEALVALLSQAREHRDAGRLEDAARALKELLALQPKHREAKSLLSSVEADVARREIEKAAAAVRPKSEPEPTAPSEPEIPPEPETVEPEPEPGIPGEARATVPVDSSTFHERLRDTAVEPEDTPPTEAVDAPEPPRSRWPLRAGIAAGVVLLAVLGLFFIPGGSEEPTSQPVEEVAQDTPETARGTEPPDVPSEPEPGATTPPPQATAKPEAPKPTTTPPPKTTPPQSEPARPQAESSTPVQEEPQAPSTRPEPGPSQPPGTETTSLESTTAPASEPLGETEQELREVAPPEVVPPKTEASAPEPSKPEPQTELEPEPTFQRGGLIEPGPGVQPPVLRDVPKPDYPRQARRARLQEPVRVVIAVLVDETGTVTQTLVKQGDDSDLGFNESALEAARQATFRPATQDGIEGKMWTELAFGFDP